MKAGQVAQASISPEIMWPDGRQKQGTPIGTALKIVKKIDMVIQEKERRLPVL